MNRPRWLLVTLFLIVACGSAAAWRNNGLVDARDHSPTGEPRSKASRTTLNATVPAIESAAATPTAVATPAAGSTAPSPPEAARETHAEPDVSPGMIVAIDPETGALGPPSVEQLRELFPPGTSVAQTPDGFVVTHRPDGSVSIDVGWQLHEYAFVRIGPDGKRVQGCAPAPLDARTIESLPAPSPQYEER